MASQVVQKISYAHGVEVLSVLPIFARRGRLLGDDSVINVQDEILVAFLYRRDTALVGEKPVYRFVVGFYPGETGHEEFYFDSLVETVEKAKNAPAETYKTKFGGTYKTASFGLCAGTPGRWKRLDTTYGAIEDVIEAFSKVIEEHTRPKHLRTCGTAFRGCDPSCPINGEKDGSS